MRKKMVPSELILKPSDQIELHFLQQINHLPFNLLVIT